MTMEALIAESLREESAQLEADLISESLQGIMNSFIKAAMISETPQRRKESLRTHDLIFESLREENKQLDYGSFDI